MTQSDIKKLREDLADKHPKVILQRVLDIFPETLIAFSGAEDVILVDMLSKLGRQAKFFSIDTGRLHPETYRFLERVRKHYDIQLEILFPDADAVSSLVHQKGLFSFYQEGHAECCGIRKVEPLRRKLSTASSWVTGQRRDQGTTRIQLSVLEEDGVFSTEHNLLLKINPLCNWNLKQIWDYIDSYDVPYNTLHRQGFVSIGCEPCTRTVLPTQHERTGRWWWEEVDKKECGLHKHEE